MHRRVLVLSRKSWVHDMHLSSCTKAEGDHSQSHLCSNACANVMRMRPTFVWKPKVTVQEKQCQWCTLYCSCSHRCAVFAFTLHRNAHVDCACVKCVIYCYKLTSISGMCTCELNMYHNSGLWASIFYSRRQRGEAKSIGNKWANFTLPITWSYVSAQVRNHDFQQSGHPWLYLDLAALQVLSIGVQIKLMSPPMYIGGIFCTPYAKSLL